MAKKKEVKKEEVEEGDPAEDAFSTGWDAEQTMADYICDNVDEDLQDDAFFGALTGLVVRMERMFSREDLLDHIANLPSTDEEDMEAPDPETDTSLN